MTERLPEVSVRWGARDPFLPARGGEEEDHELGLRQMCDYGASRYAKDPRIVLELNIMPQERDEIHRYMAARHPGVPFYCTWPQFERSGT